MSLLKTYLQDIRANHPSNNDRDELRVTQTGLLTAAMAMTTSQNSVISPDLIEKAIASQGRVLDVPVTQKGTVTINNVRSCTIAGGQSESDLVTVVWKTVSADIMMVPSQYEKNMVKYQFDLTKKINEMVEAFKVEMETDLETALDTNKSQIYASSIITDKYALVANAIQVTAADVDFFFNDLEAINFADDYYDPTIFVIANHVVMPSVSRFINQGGGNAINTNFQFAGKRFTFTNRIPNAALKLATGYFMPDGTIGLLTRVDVDARNNRLATDGTRWFEDTLPGLPFPIGIQHKSKCDDQSALEASGLEHLDATLVEHTQVSYDFAIIVPYNSDIATLSASIRKFEFVA